MNDEKTNAQPNAPQWVNSTALLDLIGQSLSCLDTAMGDTEPDDLSEYLDYPEELALEYPMVYIFHRLLEMKELVESNAGGETPSVAKNER